MMPAKMATVGLLKIKLKTIYDVKISYHDVSNKILWRESNYIVEVVKFSNSSISLREVTITSIL